MLELLANDSQRTWDPSQTWVSGRTQDERWRQKKEITQLEWLVHASTPLTQCWHTSGSVSLTGWLHQDYSLSLEGPLALNSMNITGPSLDASSSVKLGTGLYHQIWPLLRDASQVPSLHLFHSLISLLIQTVYCIIISIISFLLQKNPIALSSQKKLI